MVKIITGKINSGKSTTIQRLYNKHKKGDGFISVKNMYETSVQSYDILRLSTLKRKEFVVKEGFYDPEDIACQIGPYLFYQDTLLYIEKEIKDMIVQGITPIYLDEIGQLELYDQCFHKIFELILESNVDCVISVREDLVQEVIRKYQIQEVEIQKV